MPTLSTALAAQVLACYCCCYCCSVAQSPPTLCDPMDCSPPPSSVHGTSQARILERVAVSSSRGSSRPRDGICISCTSRRIVYHWATWEALRGASFAFPIVFSSQISLKIRFHQNVSLASPTVGPLCLWMVRESWAWYSRCGSSLHHPAHPSTPPAVLGHPELLASDASLSFLWVLFTIFYKYYSIQPCKGFIPMILAFMEEKTEA